MVVKILLSVFIVLTLSGHAWAGGEQEPSPRREELEELPDTDALVVYSYDAFPEALEEAAVDHFRNSFGVTLRFVRLEDTGGLFNQAYLERHRPEADVIIGLDNTYLGRIYQEDLFVPYEPEGLKLVDESLRVDPLFRVVPFDFGRIVLNYNREMLEDPPDTWEELLDPSLRGKIVLMNPAMSSPGRNFLLYTVAVFGEEGYLDFWRRLKPNILTVTSGWSEGYGLYTQGEAPIVLSYDTSPAYHIHYENDDRYDNLIFNNEAYAQIEVAGIMKNAANLINARRFIDFIVSEEFQVLIPLNQIMYPVHPDVVLPEAFLRINRAEKIINMDEEEVSVKFERWLKEWESVMQ
jgi:thiamine transport system substrate-binding protein